MYCEYFTPEQLSKIQMYEKGGGKKLIVKKYKFYENVPLVN